jgi:hypothetical protein
MKDFLSVLSMFALVAIVNGTASASLHVVTPTGPAQGWHFRVDFETSSTTTVTSSDFSKYDSFITTSADGATGSGALISSQAIVSNSTPKASDYNGAGASSTTPPIVLVYATKVSEGNLWSGQASNAIDRTIDGSVLEGAARSGAPYDDNTSKNGVNDDGMGRSSAANESSMAQYGAWIQNSFKVLAAPQQPYIIREVSTAPSSDLEPSTVMLAGLGGLVALAYSFKRKRS